MPGKVNYWKGLFSVLFLLVLLPLCFADKSIGSNISVDFVIKPTHNITGNASIAIVLNPTAQNDTKGHLYNYTASNYTEPLPIGEVTEEMARRGSGWQIAYLLNGTRTLACAPNVTVFDKIFSSCRISGNGICDYGENLLLSHECKLSEQDLVSGDLFKYMWFIRFLLIVALFLYYRKNPNFAITVLIIISLLVFNGAFDTVLPHTQTQDFTITSHSVCPSDVTLFAKLFSNCKIPNNGVCDYGENLYLNRDCKLSEQDVRSGQLFTYMWFLRFVLLMAAVMFYRKNPNFAFIVIIMIVMLGYNGAFDNINFGHLTPDSMITSTDTCPTDITFINKVFSSCKIPDNGICDDGEWFLMDTDCNFNSHMLFQGDIFYTMWLIRVAFILAALMFLFKQDYRPYLIAILILFFINGGMGVPSFGAMVPQTGSSTAIDNWVNYLIAHKTNLGIGLGIVAIWYWFIHKKPKKRRR